MICPRVVERSRPRIAPLEAGSICGVPLPTKCGWMRTGEGPGAACARIRSYTLWPERAASSRSDWPKLSRNQRSSAPPALDHPRTKYMPGTVCAPIGRLLFKRV